MGMVFRAILAVVFVGAGVGIYFAGVHFRKKAEASKEWPSVPAKVVSSEVEESTTTRKKGDRTVRERQYKARVSYAYEVDGTEYASDRIAIIGAGASNVRSAAQSVVGRYPAGSETKAFYDPSDPGYAVLEPGGEGRGTFVKVFGIGFAVLGVPLALFGRTHWGRRRLTRAGEV